MKTKICAECFEQTSKLNKNGVCFVCEGAKKNNRWSKQESVSEDKTFAPENEGITWFNVPSPYKKYKEGV